MANTAGCCDRELGRDADQVNGSGRSALRKAIKRAVKAQRRLNETIYQSQACGQTSSSSSSESEDEHEVNRRRGRSARDGFRSQPYPHCPRMGAHGLRDAHGPEFSMRGFPPGRHTLGFPGMMPHMGMGMHPHSHPHPGMMHHHHHRPHHHHLHRHHHHHGHFGHMPSFPGHAGPFGWGGRGGHEHGPEAGPFGRHFGGMGHASGHRERAHSFPGF